jgi:hypothetical protein
VAALGVRERLAIVAHSRLQSASSRDTLTAELSELNLTAANTVHFVERLRRLLRHFL